MDARAGLPLLGSLLHLRLWTVGLAASVIVLFWFLERTGMSFASAARAVRSWLAGSARPGRRPAKIRRRVDYDRRRRSEEHTSELQSLMRISYAVFCLKKKNTDTASRN